MLFYLAALDSGDDKCKFERLYRAYRGLMFQVARKVLRSDEDAEDAVHQAFLKLAEEPALLPSELGPRARALLVTVAERKAIDLWRVRQRHTNWNFSPSPATRTSRCRCVSPPTSTAAARPLVQNKSQKVS